MIPVQSSQIKSVGYDHEKETLYVEFLDDSVYAYFDIPEGHYSKMIGFGAKPGKYFNNNIRGSYTYTGIKQVVNDGRLEV